MEENGVPIPVIVSGIVELSVEWTDGAVEFVLNLHGRVSKECMGEVSISIEDAELLVDRMNGWLPGAKARQQAENSRN